MSGRARTYLDHNASAPLEEEARVAMIEALGTAGNPSSVHAEGRRGRALVEEARDVVAQLVGAPAGGLTFTSGASEAIAAAVLGWRGEGAAVVSAIEHPAVHAAATRRGRGVQVAACDRQGVVAGVSLSRAVERAMEENAGPPLVALMAANNETGVIQPVGPAVREVRRIAPEAFVLCDATQACGRMAVDMAALDVDAVVISGHKLGGPMGTGALVVRQARGDEIDALVPGGGQERGRRGGTENVPAIAGFAAAAELARRRLGTGWTARATTMRDALERRLAGTIGGLGIAGQGAERLCNTSCMILAGARAETVVIALDLAGVSIGAGAACSSGKVGGSHVLEAMGLGGDAARGAIRVSSGPATETQELERFAEALEKVMVRMSVRAKSLA
ncbi:MAG: aminotransferase class V-fold PLP-dependent enzyme [Rhizobiales bacterium]|nr:aminotransferase class V-fold PLP-dependent enzyme [Hyphomicrobiales bacterium]